MLEEKLPEAARRLDEVISDRVSLMSQIWAMSKYISTLISVLSAMFLKGRAFIKACVSYRSIDTIIERVL